MGWKNIRIVSATSPRAWHKIKNAGKIGERLDKSPVGAVLVL